MNKGQNEKKNEKQYKRWLNQWKHRLLVDRDIEKWTNNDLQLRSMYYPLLSSIRWDSIPSTNNEDLFRGVLCDYSALDNGFEDNIGQAIFFGVSTGIQSAPVIHTASYRGVYRTSGKHEAHIVVGTEEYGEREVEKIVVASTEKIQVHSPLQLDNIAHQNGKRRNKILEKQTEAGTLAYFYPKDSKEPAKLVFYDGEQWKSVKLENLDVENIIKMDEKKHDI